MKKILLFAIISFCTNIVFAQTDDALNYASTITTNDLKKHLTIIAGEEMEGRETGTKGQQKAAAYIEAQFKAMGLNQAPSLKNYQQFYPLYKDSGLSTLNIDGKELVYGIDYIAPITYNVPANAEAKKIVFVGYGITDTNYDDYKGKNVKGKVVVFFTGEPKQGENYIVTGTTSNSMWTYSGLSEKLDLAKQNGAVAALVLNPSVDSFTKTSVETSKRTNIYYPRESEEGANYILLSRAAAKNILGTDYFNSLLKKVKAAEALNTKSKKDQKIKFSFSYKKQKQKIDASNVIGVIEGSDKKDEYVFLTAHYDHLGKHNGKIYYGADDDGSGTCAVLEMAEAFKKAKTEGKGPRRTIVCMTVSGEEKGLWGSEYYSDHPVFPLDKTTVDLNIDMVGRVDTERKTADTLNYVYVVGHNKISTELPVINEGVNNKYTQLQLDYKFDDPNDKQRIYFRSDHYNFARKGVPVLFFYDGMLQADYHKPTDTIDKINWDLYQKRTRMIFHTAWEMANRDEMLKRDIPLSEEKR
ncbi:MAG: M28 family peptidase [Chitinophagaceae bacterium]|nr:M28 family peptidase [Chitinophagaceae bacterium]